MGAVVVEEAEPRPPAAAAVPSLLPLPSEEWEKKKVSKR